MLELSGTVETKGQLSSAVGRLNSFVQVRPGADFWRTFSHLPFPLSFSILPFPPHSSPRQPAFYSVSLKLTTVDTSYKWKNIVFVFFRLVYSLSNPQGSSMLQCVSEFPSYLKLNKIPL